LESSDEDDGGDVEEIPSVGDNASMRYLYRSASSETGRDIMEGSQELGQLAVKRINLQRK
jgi:hypothetical protein